MEMTPEQLVEKYQCIGCVAGPNPATCPSYRPAEHPGQVHCVGHVPGTSLGHPDNRIVLGLPRGFNKVGALQRGGDATPVRIWQEGAEVGWNHLNVPVWAMDYEGDRLVRTFLPRMNPTRRRRDTHLGRWQPSPSASPHASSASRHGSSVTTMRPTNGGSRW